MKRKINTCAVIEIGATSVKMGIYQYAKDKMSNLDSLFYPIGLGREIFNLGYAGFGTINELNLILSKYKAACSSFGVTNIRVVSTTVMREAVNSDIIVDRVLTQNDLSIEIIPDSTEKSLIYYDIIEKLKYSEKLCKNAIMVYIGSGSMGIARFDGENIVSATYLPLGAVKFYDILRTLKGEMRDYHSVVEEYLYTFFYNYDLTDCDTLIFIGAQMDQISKMCNYEQVNGIYSIKKKSLNKLHDEIKDLTGENVAEKYSINEDSANSLLTSLSICHELVKESNPNCDLIASDINFVEIIAKKELKPNFKKNYQNHIYDSALKDAFIQSNKFNCNTMHSEKVRGFAIMLFDKLKKVHGLDPKYRLMLELASILSNCVQYVSMRLKPETTFDLLKNFDVYGVTKDYIKLVALVSSYNEFSHPEKSDIYFTLNSGEHSMEVTKLIAIFRIANALDISQKGKIDISGIKIEDDFLRIKAQSSESTYIEEWAFNQCAKYFSEIFGITPTLTVKLEFI